MHCPLLNYYHRILFLFLILLPLHSYSSDSSTITPAFTPRSQGFDGTIQMVNSTSHTHLDDILSWYITAAYTPEFTQSFHAHALARALFGSMAPLIIQGSAHPDRSPQAILADYLYLPPDFSGKIQVRPIIQNFNNNCDFYVQLNPLCQGLYGRVYFPITYTRWNLNSQETHDIPIKPYWAGYYTPGTLDASALLPCAAAFFQGSTITPTNGTLTDALSDGSSVIYDATSRGLVTCEALVYSRIISEPLTLVGIPDIRFQIGWDFFSTPDYHAGINIQGSAPTGSQSDFVRVLFAPRLGNGHWEAGAGFSGHYTCWYGSDNTDYELSCWLTINATHLFTKKELRTFDLKGKPLSRYMPAALHSRTNNDNLEDGQGTIASFQFHNLIAPIANITTQEVSINSTIQGEIIFMINLIADNWSWDFGYNFWGKSPDTINPLPDNDNVPYKKQPWMIKGNANLFGYAAQASPARPFLYQNQAVALSASQSLATIHEGSNSTSAGTVPLNDGIDTKTLAFAGGSVVPLNASVIPQQTFFSVNPVIIDQQSIDFGSGIRGISHKIFTCISYNPTGTWWTPYIGGGFFVEWGKIQSSCSFTNNSLPAPTDTILTRSPVFNCALSQWAVFIKAGFACN